MKHKATHLPEEKQVDLAEITKTICDMIEVHFVILFGSYARGDYVEDIYVEDGITYEYRSDYDILVISKNNSINPHMQAKIKKAVSGNVHTKPSVSLIYHNIDFINKKIASNEYFFIDIKREGCILYESKEVKLGKIKKVSIKERINLAKEDYEYWFDSGKRFLNGYNFYMETDDCKSGSFLLHQAAESFYSAILLVFSHYKPKLHDLEGLAEKAAAIDPVFLNAIPAITPDEQEHFELLRKAYIESRYKKTSSVTKEQLLRMAEMVNGLQEITELECLKKIAEFEAMLVE